MVWVDLRGMDEAELTGFTVLLVKEMNERGEERH